MHTLISSNTVTSRIIYPFKTVLFLTYTPHGIEIQKCKKKRKEKGEACFPVVHSLTTNMPFLLFLCPDL